MEKILEVKNLAVDIPLAAGVLHPVRHVSFSVEKGKTLCLVGESGCGKSLTSQSIMRLLSKKAKIDADILEFRGQDLLSLREGEMSDIRGNKISMIFQEPMTALNPAYTIGNQLEEAFLRHRNVPKQEARDQAVLLLERVGITAAESRLNQYPHQLSGGLRQRVVIAMALMCAPELVIADEPTTALDVTIQAQILHLLKELQEVFQMSIILITHDLGVVARMADEVAVMYAGEIVEAGSAQAIFNHPIHPYTQGLLRCIPIPGKTPQGARLGTIPGIVPSLIGKVKGCSFRSRCPYAKNGCEEDIDMVTRGEAHQYRCILPIQQLEQQAQEAASL